MEDTQVGTATRAARPETVFDWVDAEAARREAAGLTRRLRSRTPEDDLLDLASNDYLGLTRHPAVTAAAAEAALRWGGGSTGSRLVTGTTEGHTELERELAEFCGYQAALVFSSGYTANLAVLTALAGPDTLIVSDAHNHASLIDGCRLAKGQVARAAHCDPRSVRAALAARTLPRALVVTDSVFSVDGNAAPLTEHLAAAREFGAALVLDDAHGLGVLGPGGAGAGAASGIAGQPDVVATATLSKSLGAQGGVVLGPERVIRHLVSAARTFIFDTGLNPAAVGAALGALRLLRAEPGRAADALRVARELSTRLAEHGLDTTAPDGAVVSVRADDPEHAVRWAAACRDEGLAVGCFRPPSVPDGVPRLRLTARADLTADQIAFAVGVVVKTR
ncbi:8-amino-7-oxononanoate synthase [Kitasatospora cheerisanensis]|nr:8-amino-7-oxononanoate synthase [Kitasatospora cheerisanensis]